MSSTVWPIEVDGSGEASGHVVDGLGEASGVEVDGSGEASGVEVVSTDYGFEDPLFVSVLQGEVCS